MKFIRLSIVLILFFGLGYPLLMTGIAQLVFPWQANGSMVMNSAYQVVGSDLIGQKFQKEKYFHGRISSINYNGEVSGSNNYAPSNEKLIKRIQEDTQKLLQENSEKEIKDIPIDLVTNSGSGLDPHITPEAAYFQIPRVAKENGIKEQVLRELVGKNIEGRVWIFGRQRVNVLELNLALQKLVRV